MKVGLWKGAQEGGGGVRTHGDGCRKRAGRG